MLVLTRGQPRYSGLQEHSGHQEHEPGHSIGTGGYVVTEPAVPTLLPSLHHVPWASCLASASTSSMGMPWDSAMRWAASSTLWMRV